MESTPLPRVLFVDDDIHLLRSMERLLGLRYEITTVPSALEALDHLRTQGSFDVVVADMKMPEMDGVAFLNEAQEIHPDSSYIMLTGNQDQPTAARAINEGEVFRFLVKPCDDVALTDAIDLGVKRRHAVKQEKELLRDTFLGALKLFSTVITVTQASAASSCESVERRIKVLQDALGIEACWEFKIAGYVSPVGIALLDEGDRRWVESAAPGSQQVQNALLCAAEITTSLVKAIPRLEIVAQITAMKDQIDGTLCSTRPKKPAAIVQVGSALLRAALHWHYLARQGLAAKEISKEIGELMPCLPGQALKAIEEQPETSEEVACLAIECSDLRRGMVLGDDLVSPDGALLIREGHRLTEEGIAKLVEYQVPGPISITKQTALIPSG